MLTMSDDCVICGHRPDRSSMRMLIDSLPQEVEHYFVEASRDKSKVRTTLPLSSRSAF